MECVEVSKNKGQESCLRDRTVTGWRWDRLERRFFGAAIVGAGIVWPTKLEPPSVHAGFSGPILLPGDTPSGVDDYQ